MLKKIFIPLDGSELSERALEPAAHIAQFHHAELIFARAPEYRALTAGTYDISLTPYIEQEIEKSVQETHNYLASLTQTYVYPNVTTHSLVLQGDPANAIVDAADNVQANLLVMSTHGYSGVTKWVLGSVTEKVLSRVHCPVLVIRTPQPIQHVLITLDGSELAERALEPGLAVARAFEAKVTLLRVVPELSPAEIERLNSLEHGMGLRLQDEVLAEAQAYLERLGHPAAEGVVRQGKAASTIVEQAEMLNADLVVMATHGRSGLSRWVYGSVTEKVMQSLPVNMLVVRAHG